LKQEKEKHFMKAYVFTNAQGKVIGSFVPNQEQATHAPSFQPIPHTESGQKIHEINLPTHLHNVTSPEEFHKELAKLIPSL